MLGLYWGYMGDNGKENGTTILGYMGGCQNYGPFLVTLNIRCRSIIGIQQGTIILTTTHIVVYLNILWYIILYYIVIYNILQCIILFITVH